MTYPGPFALLKQKAFRLCTSLAVYGSEQWLGDRVGMERALKELEHDMTLTEAAIEATRHEITEWRARQTT